ncbi:MAG: glutamate-1-semialdehyde 2,1-aminomutase [Candidatus Kapabacteria bacterium]|jgi:glutamate-1-semialdehyde 2,1-aminomutase|nr:glutamate-1-semialdehyde 2,1-aminomutase [Candidatus Kapabacteria bacterium]
MERNKSKQLFERALQLMPGGVNSPVRAFKSVGGEPVFMSRGAGSKLYDADGNEYIDYIGSWGPHLFGHNPDFIKTALLRALENGVSFGAPTELEVKMAELICDLVPSIEMVRMVNSGTEATMSAVRLARGYTGRDKFIKFEGCYHGHGDSFLIKAGSGALTFGVPTSPGVTAANAADTLIADYNNIESVQKLIDANKGEIAAIIVEPIAGNMGVIPGTDEFLSGLREICDQEGIVLIFDEVMSGFRVAQGGAQEVLGVTPDLTTFGKIIGGGLPVGAFGGKREIMQRISPEGDVYQAGTLSGNPLAMSAGIATLEHIKNNPDIYIQLEQKASYLEKGFESNMKALGLSLSMNRIGAMQCLFFTEEPVNNFADAIKSDCDKYGKYFREMLARGVYLAPAQFEALFVSTVHSKEDLDKTIAANRAALEIVYG